MLSQHVTTQMKSTCTQVSSTSCSSYQVLLQTAIIQVLKKQAEPVSRRTLLDSGSQINLMTNASRIKLGITMQNSDSSFTVAGSGQVSMSGKTKIQGYNHDDPGDSSERGITLPLPSMKFDKPINLPKLRLTDPNFNIPSDILVIIGAELYKSHGSGKL